MSGTTIALLPFENLSGDPAQDVIARGLSLDLAVELSRFATLDVIPPTSAAQVVSMGGSRRTTTPMFMLTGGVRRQDDRIRISVSLTETASGVQVWGDRYDAGPARRAPPAGLTPMRESAALPVALTEEPSEAIGTVIRSDTVRALARAAGLEVEVLPVNAGFFRVYRLSPLQDGSPEAR
jgi:hypothetical protein